MLEENKWATRDRNSEKDRQYDGEKKQNKTTSYGRYKTTQKTKDEKHALHQIPRLKSSAVEGQAAPSGHRCITPATNHVIRYEWRREGTVTTTNGNHRRSLLLIVTSYHKIIIGTPKQEAESAAYAVYLFQFQ